MGEDSILMQDNAPIHKARKVYEWLREVWYTVLLWPPYSPDLNSIKHLWFYLKELVHEIHPELLIMGGSAGTRKVALKEAIIEAIEQLPGRRPYLIPALCESFRDRLLAVKLAHRGPTKY